MIRAWPMVGLEHLETWTQDLIALVGDAAHAMLPVGSGGAMAALFDALA
jgi:2-polyprenyl-6-methoxyphenol hydroxylase-like FAD-dependent oxidoreductase